MDDNNGQITPFLVQVTETVTTLRFMEVTADSENEAEEKARSMARETTGDVIERRTEADCLSRLGRPSYWTRNYPQEVTWGGVRCIQVNGAAAMAGLSLLDVAITLEAWGEYVVPSLRYGGIVDGRLWDILHACSLSYRRDAADYEFAVRIRGNSGTAEEASLRGVVETIGERTRLLITTRGPSWKLRDGF